MAAWTEERRRKQSETIQRTKPWLKSTGPKTRKGKSRSSLNALKTGMHIESMREMKKMFAANVAFRKHLKKMILAEMAEKLQKNELLKKLEKSAF